ncbi:putative recombinase [Acidiphilium multivorum AIU301]|uniref:Putative recombinase n=3 Tax=Acidiphilium TaxID=522 RepID=F0J5V4_ACIMA|nr:MULTISPECIES: recombinase family protein [Acidiphilium]BAJ82498.1 putative recombinase [Acidiphilium multivorum AIU301]GAN74059.1 DNA recombinase/resolvase [Acidiphilium multivorum AIU301]
MVERFVAYLRVSTARQGQSGLGLEAQRSAIAGYLSAAARELLDEFVEVESGKNADRPQLAAAFQACRLTGARLLIAKLDRLSRDAGFLLGLEKAGVEFVAVDMPHANRLTIGIMAVVADEERRMISARTKAALAAAKARGTVLGGYRGGPNVDNRLGTAAAMRRADAFAERVGPTIEAMQAQGLSLGAIAEQLNERQIRTARGGRWAAMSVKRVIERRAAH